MMRWRLLTMKGVKMIPYVSPKGKMFFGIDGPPEWKGQCSGTIGGGGATMLRWEDMEV